MRKAYLIIFAIFTLVGCAMALENVGFMYQVRILVPLVTGSLMWPLLVIFIIGMAAGLFLGLAHGAKGPGEMNADDSDF